MTNLLDIVYALLALGACIWGFAALIKLLKGLPNDKLEIWLDFGKVFLGTFVIGLLGYFAKLSFDNRNLAILESEQIGKYVQQAMADDLEVRLRFAKYFDTVLPKDRNTGWADYFDDLMEEKVERDKSQDTLSNIKDSIDIVANKIRDSLASPEDYSRYNQLTKLANYQQHKIESSQELVSLKTSGKATILDPLRDFVTCTGVVQNVPQNITNKLPPGRVYVFARIHAPQQETVTVRWKDSYGNPLTNGTKSYQVSVNLKSGYRLNNWKTISEVGDYSVELLGGDGSLIAVSNFHIINI